MKELNNNKGFTLIELLVIIVLLSLVMGVSFYAISSSIQKAKEETYKTTINNIESEANNYLLENSNRLFFVSDDENGIEYQCITVRNLIDMGYFDSTITKSEIANDRKVKESDYIYIEKDLVSKVVTKEEFVMDTNEALVKKCSKVIEATRDIEFIIPDGYSREKEIIITYKLKNINDMNEYSNYIYLYSYPVNEIEGTVTSGNTVKVKVTENGELTGKIVYNGNNTSIEREYIESVNVTGLDNIGPVIGLGSYTSGYVKDKVTIPLKVTDSGIGVDYNSFTKDDIIVTIGGNSVSNITLENKGSGNYNLIINNTEYSGKVIIDIEANKVLDKLDNGNETVILKPNITFDHIPPIITLGTNGNSDYSKSVSSKITIVDEESGGDIDTYKYIYSTSSTATPNISFISGSNYSKDSVSGTYYLIVKACDKANNCITKVSNEFKLDNTKPTCKLKVTTDGVSFDEKSDNNFVSSFGISKNTSATYDSNTTLGLSTGTIYGYVKDEAENTGSCSVTINDINISKYDKVTQTCDRSLSYYNKTTKTCNRSIANYTVTTKYCGRKVNNYKCTKSATPTTSTSRFNCEGYGCCTKSGYTCTSSSNGTAASGLIGYSCYCTKTTYSCSTGTVSGSTCYVYANPCPNGFGISSTNYTYSFESASSTTSGSCSSNEIPCNKNNYSKTYRSCSPNYTYSFGSESTTISGSCSNNQFTCSSSTSGSTYTSCSPVYSYGFKSFTSSVDSCTTTSSKSCNNYSDYNNGNSYVSKCTPTEYSCSSGYTKVNDGYCYKINN